MKYLICGLISLTFFSPASACIQLPKKVSLGNSPFPFDSFEIFPESFTYTTSDGMRNRLNCDVENGFSWSIDTFLKSQRQSFSYEQFKSQEVTADTNEAGKKTQIKFGDTGDMAYASIKKPGGMASLQVTCQKDGQFRKLSVRVINNQGKSIGEITTSRDMTAPKTRSLGQVKTDQGKIDMNSNEPVNRAFAAASCGGAREVSPSQNSESSN